MKLRNKETGEIGTPRVEYQEFYIDTENYTYNYKSLQRMYEKWEDVPEEPKGSALDLMILTLTNFIENELDEDKVDLEECKQMLEKLKAWKRLKEDLSSLSWQAERDGEFTIWGHFKPSGIIKTEVILDNHRDDLNLLFGGEE